MKQETKAQYLLIFATVIWGAGFPLTSVALKDIGPYTLVSVKSFVAVAAILVVFGKGIRKLSKNMVFGGFVIALSLVLGNLLQTGAMVYTTSSKCSFIMGLTVVFVPIIMTMVHKKPPTTKKVVSIAVALVGLLLLTYNGDKGVNLGDIMAIASAFVYSVQILFVDKFGAQHDGVMLAAVELVFVGLLSLPPAIMLEGYHIGFANPMVIVCILVTGLLGSALGMIVQNKMQPCLNPTHAALIYLCEPVFGALFSVFIGDMLSPRALVGAGLILVAMFLET